MDFCCESNISEALEQLSEEVAILGFNPIPRYDLKSDKTIPANVIVSLSNIVWNLLKSRQTLVDKVRESSQQQSILNDEINTLKVRIKHLEDELGQNEKLVNSSLKQGMIIKKRQTVADGNMKKLKEELLRAQGLLKSRSEQTNLKLREFQEENADLKRKLMKMLTYNSKSGNSKDNKTPISPNIMLRPCNYPTISHGSEQSLSSKKEELFKKSILKLQNNIQTLALENIKFKISKEEHISNFLNTATIE